MPKLNPLFEYYTLKRVTKEQGRHYETPYGAVPSVTTILGATGDKSGLMAWRKRLGDKEATRQTVEAANIGTLVHKHLECYIEGSPRPQGTNVIHTMAREMSDKIINSDLKPLQEVWGLEAALFYPELYAGTADCIGVYDGSPAILDFKTSKKNKKDEYVEDYFLQITMYILAHNVLYNTDIRKGVILMTNREGGTQRFILEPSDFGHWANKAYGRIDAYYKKIHG